MAAPRSTLRSKQPSRTSLRSDDLQRFVDLGRLSASLIHEISNPLTAALLHLDQANDHQSVSIKATKRSLNVLKRYIEAARKQLNNQAENTSFYIDNQINEVRRLLEPMARLYKVALDIPRTPHIKLIGDPVKFQQIISNLILNAIEAYEDINQGNTVSLRVKTTSKGVVITVRDKGVGILPDQLNNIFKPLYSTKSKTGHGLGIGLDTVWLYVNEYSDASIKVISRKNIGTKFILYIPRAISS
jgi:signal transduction histidine kinase